VNYRVPAILVGGLLQTTVALWGQTSPSPPVPTQPPATQVDPKACGPGERARAGEMPNTSPSAQLQGSSGENLSDKLARTEGVICPPENIDPEIRAPAPGGGLTPVIPPPGSPGGDPSVRPK